MKMKNIANQQEIKFLVDSMLGRLAKWLRIFGYDTTYVACSKDSFLILTARKENRILLTRNTHLIKKRNIQPYVPPYVFTNNSDFVYCPFCNKYYWKGTHWKKMNQKIRKIIEKSSS